MRPALKIESSFRIAECAGVLRVGAGILTRCIHRDRNRYRIQHRQNTHDEQDLSQGETPTVFPISDWRFVMMQQMRINGSERPHKYYKGVLDTVGHTPFRFL